MKVLTLFWSISGLIAQCLASPSAPSTFFNPVLSGWHSDPSCMRVEDTFFCVTSTFESFPGLPIYASKDLIDWKLVSHVWSRESQLPGVSWNTTQQQQGMYAATIRHHAGEFWVVCEYLGLPGGIIGVLFRTKNPYDEASWSDPLRFKPTKIDPDLFWDEDGKLYVATQGIVLQELNLQTGELSEPPISLWNGTGGVWPEGPHIYKKDGWYYLLIAEGGTATNHAVTMARSRKLTGPYEPHPENPILTNRNTNEYLQTVGHADLFQDTKGNWWGMALATRSGPAYKTYPMGRETVLFPATWEKDQWPRLQPVRGKMTSAWPLPPRSRALPGDGPFNSDPDVYDFPPGKPIPRNLVHWRVPRAGAFTIGPKPHGGLVIVPSRANLTGIPFSTDQIELSGQRGIAFVGRRQTHTLFSFSVDIDFKPGAAGHEAGVTVFLTQVNHIDLGVVASAAPAGSRRRSSTSKPSLALRFRAFGTGSAPQPNVVPLPAAWLRSDGSTSLRLQIDTLNTTHYSLSAMPVAAARPMPKLVVGTAPASLVSGGNGSFVGSLLGAYATCNGAGTGLDCPAGGDVLVKRWRYTGLSQYFSATESVS
ncbi:glycoside hydrolase family 43 protein [Microdochium bolleyi]|uniref:Glycoside hydrolase family 43 protein n=1 Tax=Microdochium bolleyi TaxID=196109 RepID=A0A136ISD3_9PEZI|nr:glycoside hydrolase family 43 protein [Microdochium bolleyi]